MNTLTLALFALWITKWFTPLEYFRELFVSAWVEACIKIGFPAFSRLATIITCPTCFGFWFTLLYMRDFWMALSVSALAFVFNFIHDKITWEYEK